MGDLRRVAEEISRCHLIRESESWEVLNDLLVSKVNISEDTVIILSYIRSNFSVRSKLLSYDFVVESAAKIFADRGLNSSKLLKGII